MSQVLLDRDLLEQILEDLSSCAGGSPVELAGILNIEKQLRAVLNQSAPEAQMAYVPLTEEEVFKSEAIMSVNCVTGLVMWKLMPLVRAIEAEVLRRIGATK